jgi:hypothetical protein
MHDIKDIISSTDFVMIETTSRQAAEIRGA